MTHCQDVSGQFHPLSIPSHWQNEQSLNWSKCSICLPILSRKLISTLLCPMASPPFWMVQTHPNSQSICFPHELYAQWALSWEHRLHQMFFGCESVRASTRIKSQHLKKPFPFTCIKEGFAELFSEAKATTAVNTKWALKMNQSASQVRKK